MSPTSPTMVSSSATKLVAMTALVLSTVMIYPAHSFTVQTILTTPRSTTATTTTTSFVSMLTESRRRKSTKPATSFNLSAISSSDNTGQSTAKTLTVTLEKPLGLILEEVDSSTSSTGVAGGVIVTQVNENGSAYKSPYRDALPKMKIKMVMGKDVSAFSLEDVMDVIIDAPSPLNIEFASLESSAMTALSETNETVSPTSTTTSPKYEMGTPVTITVQQPSETHKPDIIIEARVGDNLRKTLLSNPDVELYRGLKKKLGNCGGGGQCGFCAVEVIDIDEEGKVWGGRSDYEATKIGKNGNEKTRLACMNNIVGPATVKTL